MNDLSVIDQFTSVFSTYIDSGFGLLNGNVAHLSAILIGKKHDTAILTHYTLIIT